MARDKGQVFLFSDAELSLIKSVFAENEELIYAVRNVLLQFENSPVENKLVKDFITEPVIAVLKKRIFPQVEKDLPLTQLGDLLQTLNKDMQAKGPEEMEPLFMAKLIEIEYLDQQFVELSGEKVIRIHSLDDWANLKGKSATQMYVETTARNFILAYVDGMLMHLKTIAGEKKESLEEAKKRMERNSSK